MAYTYQDHTGDAVTTAFAFAFTGDGYGYINESDIYAYVDGTLETGWSLSGPNTLDFDTAPALDAEIRIRRIMDKTDAHSNFTRGSSFTKDNIYKSFLHDLYIIHEMLDGFWEAGTIQKQDLKMGGFNSTSHPLASYTSAELDDVADAVNTAGKYLGVSVWNSDLGLPVYAAGPLAADLWVDAIAATRNTPV